MNDSQQKAIGLIVRNSTVLNKWLCKYYPFSEAQVYNHQDSIDWMAFSSNKNFNWTEDFIKQFESRISWGSTFCQNPSLPWSIEFLRNNPGRFGPHDLSQNTGIPWSYDFINRYKEKWNWQFLLNNPSIKWTQKMLVDFNLIESNLSQVNGENLWTLDFIQKYKDKFNWSHLCYNANLPWSERLIDSLIPLFKPFEKKTTKWTISPWKGLSENKGLPWSISLIKKYLPIPIIRPRGFYWDGLSRNEFLPWSDYLLDEFSNRWNWDLLGLNNGIGLTLKQIEKYEGKLKWNDPESLRNTLGANTSLYWTEELIDKYIEKWSWNDLATNEGIVWSETLIEKYWSRLKSTSLFSSPSLSWNLDLIIKYERECIDAWNLNSDDLSEKIWQKVFKPLINDEMVDQILASISNPVLIMKHIQESTLFSKNNNDPIKRLVNMIITMDFNLYASHPKFETIEKFINRIKVCLVKIAYANKNENLTDYWFLDEYENSNLDQLNNLLIEASNPIKIAIINCFDNEIFNSDELRRVLLGRKSQIKQFQESMKEGIRIRFDTSSIDSLREKIGDQAIDLGNLLIGIENIKQGE